MKVSIIVAMDKYGAIGKGGDLPWKLGTDLKKFKEITMGKPIIMGRKTFESIGKPLPGRKNIVMTTSENWDDVEGVVKVNSIEEAMEAAGNSTDIMIIGGGQIYKLFMEIATHFHITFVKTKIDNPDVFFPKVNNENWKILNEQDYPKSEVDEYEFTYCHYEI